MLSKNNFKEKLRKMEPRKERFSIRKFSVGAASVLIGFFLMGISQGQTVKADTTPSKVTEEKNTQSSETVSGGDTRYTPISSESTSAKHDAATVEQNVQNQNVQTTSESRTQNSNVSPKSSTEASHNNNSTVQSRAITQDVKKSSGTATEASRQVSAATKTSENEIKTNEAADAATESAADKNTNTLTVSGIKARSNQTLPRDEKIVATSTINSKATPATANEPQTETLRGTQTQNVNDWQGFVNAMNDSSVGTINLNGDITVANKGTNINGISRPNPVVNSGKMNLTGSNISGGLVIDGQNHTINFGDNYLSFDTNNQKDSDPWDITFKNLTINANGYDNSWATYGGAFSPIYMGGDDIDTNLLAKNKVNFENVNADVKNGAFYTTTMAQQITDNPATTVTFKGNNNITCEAVNVNGNQLYNYSSAVMASRIIFADGTNTVFNVSSAKTNNGQNAGGNILRAVTSDDATAPAIDVQQGATVTLNGNSTDVKGMLVNKAISGTVQVDGNLNANMADGHSMVVWAGNLNIGKTGNLTINTKQSNDGSGSNGVTNYNGAHFAPISLGVGFAANTTNATANMLDNAGTLTIIRTGTNNTSTTPLISFGSGNGTGAIFTLNVHNGATLDLQDGANSSYAGSIDNTPHSGLVTMWGSGNGTATYSDNVSITNPKYVNLQRTGSQTGTLFRLEDQNNHVNIQSNGGGNPLPFAQWDESNKQATPSHYWYINNLITQNNWGNNSITGFTAQGNAIGQNAKGQDKFLHSNGTVTFGGSQAGLNQYQYKDGTITQGQPNPGVTYQTPYLNNFLNDFSWWTPQRISMGTNLETKVTPTDSEKYQPVVKTIDGNTTQTLNDLTAKDGIKALLSSDGSVTTNLSPISSVSWYDAGNDATEWKTVMGDQAEPTNPTGDLKTTDKSAWAKVTYTDGSVDFANIPLNITQPMAELYTPSYKPVSVEQGQSITDDPAFTNQDGKDTTAPTGTTFTTGTDTPDWATIDPSNGTVTVKPNTDVTPGAYNIPVTVTYPDKSTDETTVPVIVTKAGQTVTWGDNGAVVTSVDTSKLNAHETTENSQVLSASGVVTAEGYELTDGKLSTTATPITIDPSTVSWTTTPDTNVATATASGKEITTSVNVDFTNNNAAKNILGSKNGVVTTNPFTIDAKGAGAKSVTAPVDIKLGSDLTSEQFGQLVDNNIPTDEIAKTEWATKPNEQGQGGVIKITFTDKDANGNPTYLNIDIPASLIKVTTDAETNTPQGQDVSTKVGEVPDAEKGIKNPGSLPSGTTYTWQDTPDTTKPGKKPAVVVVTYPDGSKDTVSTNVIVNANPEIKTITTTIGGDPAATEGIANLNNGGTTPVDGYPTSATWTTKPDTSKPGATTGTATVTYPDGTTETVTIPVAVNGQGDVTVIDNGHVFSLHANDVITHKTSDKNLIGGPVIENFKLSYYEGGQNYSKPYIYTLNSDKTAYVLTQTGDNPSGVTIEAPQSINASDIKISWTQANTILFNNALGAIKGNGQPTSLASVNNGGTKTITYTNWVNNQFGYPKYSAVVNSSSVNWPIYGKGPVSTYPFPSVYIYGAEANGTIPSVNSDVSDLKAALGDASKLVNTNDLTAAHNAEISSVDWQTLPSLTEANAKAPATVRINFTDDSYLDVPVVVNVIKVDQGVDDKTNHDIYRDITRTINIQGESTPVIQHVIYSRAKITDLSKPAGQQISYTDWAAAKNSEGQVVTNFPQYEVTKPGYTATATGATIETVDGKQYVPASGTITENSQNENVNVTYTANKHTLVINYVDGNGTVVGTYNVPGKTDETVNVDVPGHVPTNWKLVPNQQVIGSYKFGSDDPQPVDYKVEHGTENVPVDKNNKNTYRVVTQIIQEVPAGQTKTKTVRTITVPFQRTGVKDLVTGQITWNAWQGPEGTVDKNGVPTYTISAYDITPQKGYDVYVNGVKNTGNQIPAVSVTSDSVNITDTITYVKENSTPVPYDPSNKDMNMSVTRTINYEVPTGHDAIAPVTQTVEYTRDVNGIAGYQDPVTGDITWNAWHVKGGKAEFTSASVEQIKGYDSYVDGTKATEVAATAVTEKDGEPQNGATVTVSYQKQADTPVPYKPGQEGVNDDMNQYVTRTIVVHEPGQDPVSHYQTVHFTNEDKDGNSGYIDPLTGKIIYNTVWHVAGELNQADGTWAEFNAPTVKGYTPSQAKVAAEEVTAETKDVTVDINYAPVAPTGQKVTTKVGEVPDADQGIANKNDLPDGTKYTWKDTPNVTTEGNKPAVVVVTYPGGSTVEVPVTVTVTKNPTDADKYTPEGQDINTKRGVVPNPAEGIKNKSDLPDGTKYTWKDTPDVTTEGNKPATVVVTYPDGSKDEVPVTIHVTNPTTPTDADNYTPEGQDINTKTGVVPNPADGIKNKSDLPDGTKYTWKDTPDVTTAGNKPATVVVTYPDGSKDEVPVTIHVTNPSTPIPTPNTSSTDADNYTPKGQDVHTTVGKVPNASEGISNKSDLPAGTTYTWQNTPDVSTTGTHPATIIVTYPDGSKDEVTVNVIASNPDPEGQKIIVKQGETPNPADGIKNKSDLPAGTKYTWKDTPDTKTPGEKTATIVVTYPDGTHKEITVPIDVTPTTPSNTDADKYKPEGKDINTDQGTVPNPSDGIKNKNDLPDGTKYTWKNTPDVSTPGKHSATIVITYPDGSKDKVTITITVKSTTSLSDNNGSSQDNGPTTQTTRGSSSSTLTHINNESPKEQFVSETQEMSVPSTKSSNVKTHTSVSQRSLPQTGEESKSGIIGLAIAALGSLFGFASTKKRKRN